MDKPEILEYLPQPLWKELRQKTDPALLEELHLRLGRRTEAVIRRRSVMLEYRAAERDIRLLMEAATRYSLYAVQEYLKSGFCTTPDGCRIGLTGTAAIGADGILSIRDISAINIRIARQLFGVADSALAQLRGKPESTLIIGPPGSGKTTLLRDLIRQISDRLYQRVGVVDSRFELSASCCGVPKMDLGERTDVIVGCEKEAGILLLLRSMNPQWIAVDEITSPEDVQTMARCAYCGVQVLATAHADSSSDLLRRPVYRQLLERRIFRNLISLDAKGRYLCTEMEELYD